MRFDLLRTEVNRRLASQHWNEALNLIQQSKFDDSSNVHHLMAWKIIAYLGLGEIYQSGLIFQEALNSRIWWSPELISEIPAWKELCEMPEYAQLVRINRNLQLDSQKNAKPELEITLPENLSKEPVPLLLCLHGRMSTSGLFKESWNTVLNFGWATALAQSSQLIAFKSYIWDDFSIAKREISSHIKLLIESAAFDSKNIFIAGFSQGADLALRLLNEKNSLFSGLLAIAPAFTITLDVPIIQKKPVVILTGENDERWYPKALEFKNKLVTAGSPVYYSSQKDCGHEFPEDYKEQIPNILSFLKNRNK